MHHTDIFATSAKAATNSAPVPHPPWHQTKRVHTGYAVLPRRHQKVPGRGENRPPPIQPFWSRLGMVLCRHTQRQQPTTPGTETIPTESSNHELIDGIVSAPGGVGWWCCELLWRTYQKLMLLAIARSGGQNSWFGVKFQTQTSTKITLESSDQGLSIGVIKMQWFYCEIILY